MQKEVFGCIGGRTVMKYSFGSDALRVSVLDFGAAVQSLVVNGLDVALGFAHGEDYAVRGGYLGGNIGRTANRIANAAFSLNGRTYHLTKNEGENHLHGGRTGFNRVFYTVEERENGLTMTALSPDGDEATPAI